MFILIKLWVKGSKLWKTDVIRVVGFFKNAISFILLKITCNRNLILLTEKKKSQKNKVKLFSRVRLLATLWTVAYWAPLSMGYSRQEYWSGLPLPSPSLLFTSQLKSRCDLCGRCLLLHHPNCIAGEENMYLHSFIALPRATMKRQRRQ